MKRFTLVTACFCVILFLGANAQQVKFNKALIQDVFQNLTVENEASTSPSGNADVSALAAPFDTIWYEDFATGIPAGWTLSGPNQLWKHTYIGSTGQFSTGNKLNSTSKANGWIIFDADSANPGGSSTVFNGSIISPSIDLTGKPDVKLMFQQFLRFCCSSANASFKVAVSNNGGTTWTDFDARRGLAVNASSPNPQMISINISAVAGNKSDVKIRFTWAGVSHYHWQIDDIAITEAPANDIVLEKDYTDFAYLGSPYYTQVPLEQAFPMGFRTAILNDGAAAQTDVKLNVLIKQGSDTVFNENSTPVASMAKLTRDTLVIQNEFTPTVIGAYTTTFTIKQNETDDIPGNNSIVRNFAVSDSVFAHDNGVTTGIGTVSPSNYIGGDVNGAVLGSIFEPIYDAKVNSASVFIHSSTRTGLKITARMYEWDDLSQDFNTFYFLSSNEITIGTATKNKWVTFPFIGDGVSEIIAADNSYLVGFEVNNINNPDTDEFHVGNDATTPQVNWVGWLLVPGSSWGTLSARNPMIRLNLGKIGDGISESELNGIKVSQNYPNPFSNETEINYELKNSSDVSIEFTDITGRAVKQINEGRKTAGSHSIAVNGSEFAKGVYFYTLQANQTKLTRKMIVIE